MKTENFGRSYQRWYLHPDSKANRQYPYGYMELFSIGNVLKMYRQKRENGDPIDNPERPFPNAGIDALNNKNIKSSHAQYFGFINWPDMRGRYWWKITLNNGQVINDVYWKKDKAHVNKRDQDPNWLTRKWFTVHHTDGTKIEGFSHGPAYENGYPDEHGCYWYYIYFTDTYCPAIRQWMEEKDFNYLKRLRVENPDLFKQELADLKRKNHLHSAIAKIDAMVKKEDKHYQIRMVIRILYQPHKIKGGFNLFSALPDELQLMVLEFVLGVKLTQDLFKSAKNCAIQKEFFTKSATPDLSKREGKQTADTQSSLHEDTIKQLSIKPVIQHCWFESPDRRPAAIEAIETLKLVEQSQSSTSQSVSSSELAGGYGI